MKIINNENGQEVVYVQKYDMMFIMHNCDSLPAALMEDFFSDIVIINGDNRFEFVRFTDPSEVEFFKKQDWIIDYADYKDLTEEEIMEKGMGVIDEINAVAQEFNDSSSEKQRATLYDRHELLNAKLDSVKVFLWYKQGHIHFQLPVVEEDNHMVYVGDDKLNKKESGIKRLAKRLFGRK